MLLGSVLIPAGLTWRVMSLLRANREVIEPARLLQSQLELGLVVEAAALREYTLTGEGAPLALYRSTARSDDRRLGELARLGRLLDGKAVARVAAVQQRIRDWRLLNAELLAKSWPSAELTSATETWEASHDSASLAFTELATFLRTEVVERQAGVRALESWSLVVNASLVLVAFAAMISAAGLIRRERRLMMDLERRIDAEVALRNVAQALAAAFTFDEVTHATARSALDATQARGVFVEQFVPGMDGSPDAVIVRASAGIGAPLVGSVIPYTGSYAETAVRCGEAIVVGNLGRGPDAHSYSPGTEVGAPAIVVPIGDASAPIGALFVLADTGSHLRTIEMTRARTFGHLAALAYEKVWLLNAARDRREELERVMKSRSGLMRGFSHDVKNPLGAADGYAELLTSDMYGPLSATQKGIIGRIRRSIRGALSLIDQIHTLARAETGHLELTLEPVDLGELVATIGEEYEAEARNHGLELFIEVSTVSTIVKSDAARTRQIVGNLVSNAIKYTKKGSVLLRTEQPWPCPIAELGPCAAVHVIDTGPGIPLERQGLVFDEFVRLGGSDEPGTGLGLAISRRLAQALHGEITVDSEPGGGSTFTLWLPLPRQEDRTSPTDPDAEPKILSDVGAPEFPSSRSVALTVG